MRGRLAAGSGVPAATTTGVGDVFYRIGLDDGLGGATARVLVSTRPPVDGRVVAEQVAGRTVYV